MATTEATRCAQFSGTPSITKQKNLIYIWLLSSIGLSFFVNSCEPQSAPGKSCSDYLRWILCLPHCVKKVTFCFIFRKRMQKQAEFVLRAKVKVFARMLFCRRYSRAWQFGPVIYFTVHNVCCVWPLKMTVELQCLLWICIVFNWGLNIFYLTFMSPFF